MTDKVIDLPTNILDAISMAILPYKHSENIVLEKIEKEKKIIICIHKDISKKEIDILLLYGNILFFEDCHINIKPSELNFDYLIIDLRKNTHRDYYKLYLYNKKEDYYYILYRYWFESNNGCLYNNEITEFPSQQPNKKNYDNILLLPNIYEPIWYISLFRLCCTKE
jgi:hypothetical protein